ncbi:MAG: galactokinase [Desulfobacterales bacterium]|jgi:D-glycero-alpha-D-manno-heptose-7-phosphate kinase|nr:galactokinase [Desulfobacteraceae bacterium]MDY0311429.1 galactokinase [Desulfobacterales bacterium]
MSADGWPALAAGPVVASAPCRIDVGGTLDLAAVGLPLDHLAPCTVNIALDLRTRVSVSAGRPGRIEVAANGFAPAAFAPGQAPYDHPLGLIFAVADSFGADGVRIEIASSSPPRSALGGSSVAAVALVAALTRVAASRADRRQVALLARRIEGAAAGVACGLQDQLAAAYGGINAWYWAHRRGPGAFRRRRLAAPGGMEALNRCFLVAYGGNPHVSLDVNGRWVQGFRHGGAGRELWRRIAALTHEFIEAWENGDLKAAGEVLNTDTRLRRQMTPEVLDEAGHRLVEAAVAAGCGARFAGAGGGGCLWALGTASAIAGLRETWQTILASIPDGRLLDARVDARGVAVSRPPADSPEAPSP